MMRLKNILQNLLRAFLTPLTGAVEVFRIRKFRLIEKEDGRTTWIMEAPMMYAYLFRYYYYLKAAFSLGVSPHVIWLNTDFFFKNNRHSAKSRFMDRLTHNRISFCKWKWVFQALRLGEWISFTSMHANSLQKEEARRVFQTIRSKEELGELKIGGVWVGDLIYDTYLRFKPNPTVNMNDPFLLELIEKAILIQETLEDFFKNRKIDRVVAIYSSYIQHGLLVRVALKNNIEVHCVSDDRQLISAPTPEFLYHSRNLRLYRKWFQQIPNKAAALAKGKELIETRLSGAKDLTAAYMEKSAFSGDGRTELLDPRLDSRQKIVFMVHDFFDSPHGYGKMLFADFYEWMETCLSLAKDSPFQFLVKPHPRGIPANVEVEEYFRRRFQNVVFLDKSTPNALIAKLNPYATVTVHGTVAHEFAALNLPVVTCGDNPQSEYGFSYQAKSKEELAQILKGQIDWQPKINLEEIYEFMYVHNFRLLRDDANLFSVFYGYKDCLREFALDPGPRVQAMIYGLGNLNVL